MTNRIHVLVCGTKSHEVLRPLACRIAKHLKTSGFSNVSGDPKEYSDINIEEDVHTVVVSEHLLLFNNAAEAQRGKGEDYVSDDKFNILPPISTISYCNVVGISVVGWSAEEVSCIAHELRFMLISRYNLLALRAGLPLPDEVWPACLALDRSNTPVRSKEICINVIQPRQFEKFGAFTKYCN